MKLRSTLTLLFFCVSIGIKAQMPVTVTTDSLSVGKSNLPAFSVNIPEAPYESNLKAWIKELESGSKSKVLTENGTMSIFGSKIKDISPNPINVYSKLIKLDSVSKLTVSFELKKDQYVERMGTPAEFAKAETFIKNFAKDRYIDVVKDYLDTEEKKLRDIEKELSSLEREKNKMQKSISSNNTTITKENDNITIQNNELTTVSAALIEHNKLLGEMTDGPDKDAKVKYIKDLEKRQKKAQNSIEDSNNKINRTNNDTDKINGEIPNNEKQQEKVNERIQAQQAVVGKVSDKLKKIKSY